MLNRSLYLSAVGIGIALAFSACKSLSVVDQTASQTVPERFQNSQDSTNTAQVRWKDFFKDPYLNSLIDSALHNNQELNITLQEIQIARNEVRARKGEYLPFLNASGAAGVDKVGRYTSKGSSEATTDIKPGQATPDPLPDFMFGAYASWELDIWHKLRNAKKSAYNKYLSTVEGKNFMVTNLVSEIASAYYELLALDTQLDIVKQNIEIQSNALKTVKLEKEATRVTELAVRKFEAEVYHTRSLQFDIQQQIIETENKLNFLAGRFPQPVARSSQAFSTLVPDTIYAGLPSQLLENRRDIKQAELDLAASKLDVKVAKARFYPSLTLHAGVGFQAFNPAFLIQTPQSMLYSLAGDLMAPLINRNALKATYYTANSKQFQAVYNYQKTVLNAYIEVVNQISKINNLKESYNLKDLQVQALNQSITISTNLFKSAKADYMEVLLTQRDALESKFELIETKMQQMHAMVNMYRALGGGWN
jgi:multidrug efflux system outer membrane protein